MKVTLIGMGSGQPENLTLQGLAALRQADLILGARRLLAVLPAGCTENRAAAYRPDEVAELGAARPFQHPAAGGGAGPSVAGVEPCFGPWPHL